MSLSRAMEVRGPIILTTQVIRWSIKDIRVALRRESASVIFDRHGVFLCFEKCYG